MAITNAQQYQQLVKKRADGKRPGYVGRDHGGDKGPETGRDARDNREIGARKSRTRAAADARQRSLAAYGDPDPEVDIAPKNRQDTITSFTKNFTKNFEANPFSMLTPLGTLVRTSFQTNKAQQMMGLPGFDYTTTEDDDDGKGGDGVFQDPCRGPNPPAYCFVGIRSAETTTPVEEDETINYRLMADGGRAALAEGGMPYEGGIMDLESSRQMYGLGKLVKKITRGVKKIAKSPIGKAALLYAGGSYLSGMGAFGGLKGAGVFNSQALGLKNFLMGKPGFFKTAGDAVSRSGGFLDKIGGKYGAGILGSTALSYLMTPKEEDEDETLYAGADIDDPRTIMANPSLYTNRRLAAEGGSMDEPVAKKTMPLLDMDGKEMDLRAEGGFVPLGRMERADDVPARLSKNEFVFTADAVRNAGEGDVDKGAEVMYNMMKNLESGGDVSEESQGLEGAREMFQTSQRLEEVI